MPGNPFSSEDDVYDQAYTIDTMTKEQAAYLRNYYGMDKSLEKQILSYLVNLCHGDMGYSIAYKQKVTSLILNRLPWTLFVVLVSLLLSSLLGSIIGAISAWYRNSFLDKCLYTTSILVESVPSFVLALLLIWLFAITFHCFPMAGGQTPFVYYNSSLTLIFDMLFYAALPIATLVISRLGEFYLLSRNSMLTVLTREYIRTAKAKGIGHRAVLFRHALRNAILPIVTRVCMSIGTLFSGSILVENIFAYPGVGLLMGNAIANRDYVLLQGIFIFISVSILCMNQLSDLIYCKLDPRVNP